VPADAFYDEAKHSDRYRRHAAQEEDEDVDDYSGKPPKAILDGDAGPQAARPRPVLLTTKRSTSFSISRQSFRSNLTQGISVIKYGRSGPPRDKTLTLFEETGELTWRDSDEGARGRRFVMFGQGNKDELRVIALSAIDEVRRGVTTAVLQKALPKVDPQTTLSFITNSRTLDVALASVQDREALIKTMKEIFAEKKMHVKII